MKKNTKRVIIGLAVIVVSLVLFFSGVIYNTADDWVYIKINDKIYVANDADIYKDIPLTEIGTVEDRCLSFIKPTKNNQSNGFPEGVAVYEGTESECIYVEEGEWFLKLNLEKDN